jgi:hypothetical protein
MKQRLWIVCFAAVLLAQLMMGCRGCSKHAPLAVLDSRQGEVQREAANSKNSWKVAEVGTGFDVGDALRTRHASTAHLNLAGGGKLQVRQDTVIRFQNRRPAAKKHDFDVETGQVMLEAADEELLVEIGKGVARIAPNGQVLVRRTSEGLQFEVSVGKARFEEEGSETQTIEAGQTFVVKIGSAVADSGSDVAGAHTVVDAAMVGSAETPGPEASTGIAATVRGKSVSQKVASEHTYRILPEGSATLSSGTTLQVGANSSVEVAQNAASVSLVGAGRYTVRGDKQGLVEVHNGQLTLRGAARIIVPGGVIETHDNSAADVRTLGNRRTHVKVLRGQVNLSGTQGTTKVAAGEEATLAADGATLLEGRGLGYADLTINAGESVVVHDPKPPTAIRIAFASLCTEGGTIHVQSGSAKQFASGETSAALRFASGRRNYTLRCLGQANDATAAHGTITVVRDAGTRPMPVTPPATTVNVDGRNYTVMYQNQLPSLTVAWPNAPASSNFTLHLESHAGSKTVQTSSPSYTFRSGTLPEGRHTVYFESETKVSRRTGIDIAFDNAAPTANLSVPVPEETGNEMTISGVALPGWQVEIAGSKIEQDGQQRFSQKVQVPQDDHAVAVKLIHPTRGVHVYIRRTSRGHD